MNPQPLSPTQLPVVLSSNLPPPPIWPLPITNMVMLPVVPTGWQVGPFTPLIP